MPINASPLLGKVWSTYYQRTAYLSKYTFTCQYGFSAKIGNKKKANIYERLNTEMEVASWQTTQHYKKLSAEKWICWTIRSKIYRQLIHQFASVFLRSRKWNDLIKYARNKRRKFTQKVLWINISCLHNEVDVTKLAKYENTRQSSDHCYYWKNHFLEHDQFKEPTQQQKSQNQAIHLLHYTIILDEPKHTLMMPDQLGIQ